MSHYAELQYSRNQVKRAGKIYINPASSIDQKEQALKVINNWRAAHAFPLQIIYCHLKKISNNDTIVAQRLKRLESITGKLTRFPFMSLCTMQDIGGCRVIVDSLNDVYCVVERIRKSRMRHKFKEEYDYIKNPKNSGYRSYHIVLSYLSDKSEKYNGLLIEIQIRTRIQHLWATSVETMDIATGDSLKTGFGKTENERFFVLTSKLLEIYEENGFDTSYVKKSKTLIELKILNDEYHILETLNSIRRAGSLDEGLFNSYNKKQGYYLMVHNRNTENLKVSLYLSNVREKAILDYNMYEQKRLPEEDVVLVSTSSYETLKKAYPNYFSDIGEFVTLIKDFLK